MLQDAEVSLRRLLIEDGEDFAASKERKRMTPKGRFRLSQNQILHASVTFLQVTNRFFTQIYTERQKKLSPAMLKNRELSLQLLCLC